MKRFFALCSLLFALVILQGISAYAYTKEDQKAGAWGDLAKYIGLYDYEAVLNDARVKKQLSLILSSEELKHLRQNLNVRSSIGFDAGCLVLSGNAPHKGGQENALVDVCLYKGEVYAAVLSDQKVIVYAHRSVESYESVLPRSMRSWVFFVKNPQALKKPEYVEMKSLSNISVEGK
jgi:hypothetical protein